MGREKTYAKKTIHSVFFKQARTHTCGCSRFERIFAYLYAVIYIYIYWLVVWNIFYFSIYWECHHPNWRSPSFFRGVGIPPTRLYHFLDPKLCGFIPWSNACNTLWLFNIAIEHGPFIVDFPIKNGDFPLLMAIFNSYVSLPDIYHFTSFPLGPANATFPARLRSFLRSQPAASMATGPGWWLWWGQPAGEIHI